MTERTTNPTQGQIEAKRGKVTDEFLSSAIAFMLSVAEAERAGDINSVQADIVMDLYNSKLAKLLNGRVAGLDARGKQVQLSTSEDIRDGLAESLARIENLGPNGCEECEKHWAEMLAFKQQINKAVIVAQADAIKKAVEKGADLKDVTSTNLAYVKPEGSA